MGGDGDGGEGRAVSGDAVGPADPHAAADGRGARAVGAAQDDVLVVEVSKIDGPGGEDGGVAAGAEDTGRGMPSCRPA